MALSITSIANLLFKKNQGKSSTNDARQFFEEPIDGRPAIFPQQVWAQADLIPTTAPTLADQAVSGVVKRWVNLQLAAVPGVANAFSNASLKNCIPFNFGDGSYNYQLFDSGGAAIPFGQGDWIVDPATGTVTFYTTVPGNMPPKISFFQYVGTTGLAAATPQTLSFIEQSADPAAPASGQDTLYFKTGGILYSMNSAGVIRQLATLAGAETLTNKTLTSAIANFFSFTNQAAPATPAAGSTVLYAGTNNALMQIDSTGAVKQLGTLTGTETFTNKTLTSPILNLANYTDQTATPTTPAAGTTVLYTQSKNLMLLDSGGVVRQLASLTGTETLTNKTLTAPIISNGQFDFETFTDQSAAPTTPATGKTIVFTLGKALMTIDSTGAVKQVATLTGVETLTNKTLTGPIIDIERMTDQSADPATPAAGTTLIYTKAKNLWMIDSTGAIKQQATLQGVETFTNKTITTPIIDIVQHTDQASAPATPAAGTTLIYSRNNQFYRKGFDGIESVLGGGSGSGVGGKNYLQSVYDGTSVQAITSFQQAMTFNAASNTVDINGDIINYTSCPWGTGQAVTYTAGTTAIGGLTTGTIYWVVRIVGQSGIFGLATTVDNAQAKRLIDLTSQGAGTHQFQTASTGMSAGLGGASSNISQSVNTTSPLRNPSNVRLSKAAANAIGNGWMIPFVMDRADVDIGRPMKLAFKFRSSANFTAVSTVEDGKIQLYDVDNQMIVPLDGSYQQVLPVTLTTAGFQFGFTPNAGGYNYRFIISNQNVNTNAYDLDFADLEISSAAGQVPGFFSQPTRLIGTIPTPGVTTGTAPTKYATPLLDRQFVGRSGEYMRLVFQYRQGTAGTSGTSTADYVYPLPNGLQFDPSRTNFTTEVGNNNGNVNFSAKNSYVAGTIQNGSVVGTAYVVPFTATTFRMGITYSGNNISGRGFQGASFLAFGEADLGLSIDVLLPILGYDASATYSTQEIALKQVPTSLVMSPQAITGGVWNAFTGNSMLLQPGLWDLYGTILFNNNGSNPQYTGVQHGWFAANGAGSATVPALLTTLPQVTLYGYDATNNAYITKPLGNVVNFSDTVMPMTLRVTQPTTIFYNALANAVTPGNARVNMTLIASKRPDYSAFGVYGKQCLSSFFLTTAYSPAAGATIIYDTVREDTDSAYNKTTGLWTCPITKGGIYEFAGKAQSNAAGAIYVKIAGTAAGYLLSCPTDFNYGGTISRRIAGGQTVAFIAEAALNLRGVVTNGPLTEVTIKRIGD